MTIKGYKKHFVILKGIGSDYIEEAYLVLRKELPRGTASTDIVKEATRLISEYHAGKKRKRPRFSLPSFLIGAVFSGVIAGLLTLFL